MQTANIIIIGILMLTGVIWQAYLVFEKDLLDGPKRVIPAAIVAGILFLGITVHSIFRIMDGNSSFGVIDAFAFSGKAFLFGIVLALKSYLGPILIAVTLSFVSYHLFTYGEFHTIPFVQSIFHWLFTKTPEWASVLYLLGVFIYAAGSSAVETFDIDLLS